MDLVAATNATVTAIAKAIDYFKTNVAGTLTDTSLTSISKITRAEPLTIISNDCANLTELPEILNTLVSVYSGYFLQAIAIMTRLNDVEVVRILDKLSPDRDNTGFLLQSRSVLESASNVFSTNYKYSLPTREIMAVETDRPMVGRDNQKMIYEASNLAVGKILDVAISIPTPDGETKTVNVPVTVRLSPTLLNDETLSYLFTNQKTDDSIVERYHSWRAGRISLIRDMVFCEDLIREYRRAAIKDRSVTLQEIVRRVTNARAYGLLTKNPSLAVASNIYVLSKASAHYIESKTGEKFSTPRGREKILKDTYAMIVAIVDADWGQVTFYFNGIAYPSTMSLRSMKSSGSKGPDIADIMRSLMEGRAPTF